MNLLVLGGTRFLGHAIVEAALERGHDVTMFNRGSHRDVFPEVPRMVGDRGTDDVEQLSRTQWECVVDVNGYKPAEVRRALRAVGEGTQHYLYISTVSVYDTPPPGGDENAPLLRVDESIPDDSPDAYGGRKVLCEELLRQAIGARLTVLRPTVVVGEHDYTDRFPWWVRSIARGGRMEVPRRLEQPVQLIDARDLGAFAVHALEGRIAGTFNAVGPREPLTLGGMVTMLADALGSQVEPVPVDPEGHQFPLTLPEDGSADGYFSVSAAAAHRAGLTLRLLTDSAMEVLRAEQARAETR